MKRPLFSILTCTVGKPDLIKESIRSVLNQTVADWEIIVTDTSGTDVIKKIVEQYQDPRIHFYPVPENNPSLGWDFAYSKSDGQYVLWYDDDNCLIPGALARFKEIIEKERPDIVSGNHVYFLGPGNRHHPHYQNTLIFLPPFTMKKVRYDPKMVLRAIYNSDFGSSAMPARWHSAATFVSREICEKIKARTGSVITPRLQGNFHIHPLIFAFAQKAIYDDRPLCVIGKFASSVTQQWSNVYAKQKMTGILPYRFTGVTARTLGNTTAECHLQAQQLLPEQLGGYQLNFEKFYDRYISELTLIDLPLSQHLYHWYELWQAPNSPKLQVLAKAGESLGIHLLRALRLWDQLRKIRHRFKGKDKKRVVLNLEPFGVKTISACAEKLDEILKRGGEIERTKAFWDSRPCNIRHSAAPIGTAQYFREVAVRRYFVESHIPVFADFRKWEGKKVLEIGCGIGTDAAQFAIAGGQVTAADLSSLSLEIAAQHFKLLGLNSSFFQANAEELSQTVPIEAQDLIYSFGVIHHTSNPANVLQEIKKYCHAETELRIMLYAKWSWKLAWIILKFGKGQFWKWRKLLAQYSEAQEGSPVTYAYSGQDVRDLFWANGFEVVELKKTFIFPYQIDAYRKYQYKKVWYFRYLPKFLFNALQSLLGWHMLIIAKPKRS